MTPAESSGENETIIEFAVRERLTKEQISDLLASLGGQRQGSREEVDERLLAITGLKPKDVLSKLSTEGLRVIVRRFDVPQAAKPTGPLGFAASILGDERSALIKRIEPVAEEQRAPTVASKPPTPPPELTPPAPKARQPKSTPPPAAASRPEAPVPAPVEPPTAPPVHAPVAPAGSPVGLPAFQETRDFVGSYKFAYQWDSEDLYEAELLGALRGRFGANNAIRQQGESGRVYDIVVRNSARVEVKVPKQKTDLDRMSGQVRRYLAQHPGGVIVVIVGFMMRNQQEIHNAQADLESAGAVVFQVRVQPREGPRSAECGVEIR